MDDDIRDVLFGEVDDFEELDDDFMATVCWTDSIMCAVSGVSA